MKMKYIIELEDEPFGRNDDPKIPHGMDELWRVKGFNSLVFDKNGLMRLEPLDVVIEEFEAKAYQRGYENGFAEGRKRTELSEEKDDEIRVGDEVIVNGLTGVVMRLDEKGNVDRYFTSDGKTFGNISGFQNNEVIKTGRHFPEVEKILEAMRK